MQTSVVEIVLVQFTEHIGSYTASIVHQYQGLVLIPGTTDPIPGTIRILEKDVAFSVDEIDFLSQKAQIDVTFHETAYRDALKRVALLYYVQHDFIDDQKNKTIYNLDPDDWEICNNP
ncbi:hypothetical protein B0A58_01510 [Flavobacterium branchiophilum NBRC 15030 = ATCC 35035]|uniref:Uncharacterized protein n=1 Tax=Flavobacterium branchiophilum TaxID=55197 RepID=A0A543G103_9FLAO|nr:hypothetical protein [Flavobacterium branchiophilum]OXA81207.1 hypothetical protein B0A58_01510 [Flavobacterium branchiophilum NBRC 15030 = ATCC 35035]TQM39766.1 hypothetical protein BC670_0597 [Flavobacterium branchiophilum]